MTPKGLYGDRLAKLLPILDDPNALVVKSMNQGAFAATRRAGLPGGLPSDRIPKTATPSH